MMFALTYLAGIQASEGHIIAEGPMFYMFKILYDRKVGAVFMLSGFTKNTELVKSR